MEASSGSEAIDRAAERPALIVLDLGLPDMPAWKFVARFASGLLRQPCCRRGIPTARR